MSEGQELLAIGERLAAIESSLGLAVKRSRRLSLICVFVAVITISFAVLSYLGAKALEADTARLKTENAKLEGDNASLHLIIQRLVKHHLRDASRPQDRSSPSTPDPASDQGISD